jgi:peroxin-3
LLTIFTRIQLNLLGRRNYLSSVISLATPPANASTISLEDNDDELTQTLGDDFETNRRYLAFSWWLLHRGWKDLMGRVQTAVEEVFGPLNPREDISLAKLSELTLEIRRKIEGSTEDERRSQKWLSCLLPPAEEEEHVLRESGVEGVADPSSSQTALKLRHLLDETADLIDSPSFSHVLTLLNNEGFSTLIDQRCAADAFKAPTSAPETAPQSFDSIATVVPLAANAERKTKLANLLAVMARQAHVIGNGVHHPNEYLAAMDQNVRELEAFSAVVYSSNFDLELLGARNKVEPRETDPDEPVSPSFSHVMVEKEVDVELDLKKDEPAYSRIVELDESVVGPVESSVVEPIESSIIEPVETSVVGLEGPVSSEAPDSAFEQAWGKAVDDGKNSPVEEIPREDNQGTQ